MSTDNAASHNESDESWPECKIGRREVDRQIAQFISGSYGSWQFEENREVSGGLDCEIVNRRLHQEQAEME
jgi:hypothetical protein